MLLTIIVLLLGHSQMVFTEFCVNDCLTVPHGNYHSCAHIGTTSECSYYISCGSAGSHDSRPCGATLVWDDALKICDYTSSTCENGRILRDPPATTMKRLSTEEIGTTPVYTTLQNTTSNAELHTTDYVLTTADSTTEHTSSVFTTKIFTSPVNTHKLTTTVEKRTSGDLLSLLFTHTATDFTPSQSSQSSYITSLSAMDNDLTTTVSMLEQSSILSSSTKRSTNTVSYLVPETSSSMLEVAPTLSADLITSSFSSATLPVSTSASSKKESTSPLTRDPSDNTMDTHKLLSTLQPTLSVAQSNTITVLVTDFATNSVDNNTTIQLSHCSTIPTWQGIRFRVLGMTMTDDGLAVRYSCQSGYLFSDGKKALFRLIECTRSGEWTTSFVTCQPVKAGSLDRQYMEPVEAEHAVYIAVAAIVFLVCEGTLLVIMDVHQCWRNFCAGRNKHKLTNTRHFEQICTGANI